MADRFGRLPEPPAHLGEQAADLWRQVVEGYELDATALLLLATLCDATERYEQARRTIAEEGPFVVGRFGPKAHPAIQVERDNRVIIARLVRELDLEGLPLPTPKKPPRRGGVA